MGCSISLIDTNPLFSALSADERESLCQRLEEISYQPLEAICREGRPPSGWFLLLAGRVRISRTRPDGGQELIAWLEPGAMFGTAGMLDGLTRPTTAAAAEPSRCLRFPRALLEPENGAEHLNLCLREILCRALNDQLRAANHRLLSQARRAQGDAPPTSDRIFGGWRVPTEEK